MFIQNHWEKGYFPEQKLGLLLFKSTFTKLKQKHTIITRNSTDEFPCELLNFLKHRILGNEEIVGLFT